MFMSEGKVYQFNKKFSAAGCFCVSSVSCVFYQFYGQNSTFEFDIVSPSFLVYKHHQLLFVMRECLKNHLVFKDKSGTQRNKVYLSHFLRPADLLPTTDTSVMHPVWTARGHSTAY